MKKKQNKANQGELNGLHGLLADYFSEQLQSGEELSSGTLAAINSFLKTNNITAEPTETEPMQNLQNKITQLMLDDGE